MNSKYFYQDKPLFGLDIGFSTIKVMQIEYHNKQPHILGYGVGGFNSAAIKDGVIEDLEAVADATKHLFEHNIVGEITTRRVALAVPASRTYTRTINLPQVKNEEIDEAVRMEAEQYIPMALSDLYLDYQIIHKDKEGIEILAVAAPKKIVDSQLDLARVLGLEPVELDTSILAAARLFQKQDEQNDIPAVLVDFGSVSADITVHDKTVIVTGTIPQGGDTFTELIAKKLKVTKEEAHVIKSKYGIGKSKKQSEILEVIKPPIEQLAKEISRMIRYHEERSGSEQKIGQIVTMGGGANMPGLSDLLTEILRLPVRTCEPWHNIKLDHLKSPSQLEKSVFVTVAGLSLIGSREVYQQ